MTDRNPRRLSVRRGLVIIVAVALGLRFAFDALFFPWSHAWFGMPALVGEWRGELVTPTGQKQHLALMLQAETGRCTSPCSRLKAAAQLCDPQSRKYLGLGTVENWSGSSFHVSLSPAEPGENARPFQVRAQWQGGEISGSVSFGPRMYRESATVTEESAAPGDADRIRPIPVTLRRGRDDTAQCGLQ